MMNRVLLVVAWVLIAFSARLSAKPNILFILADDQRADAIQALGNPRISTPNLDALVARGMTFSRATCSYPICVVSRAEIMTGQHGWENGVYGQRGGKFDEEKTPFWAATFAESGWRTGYVGKWHTSGRPAQRGYSETERLFAGGGAKWWKPVRDYKGFPVTGYRGWIFQSGDGREKFPDLGVGVTPDISEKIAEGALAFFEKTKDEPWLLQVNFTAPHDPLFIPPGWEERIDAAKMKLPENFLSQHPFEHGNFAGRDECLLDWPRTPDAVRELLAVYYAIVEDMDLQIGKILEAVEARGELDNTIVIYASDHGMAVGSHGLRGKQNQYEHTINTPMILAGPGIVEGASTEAQVYLRELFPTTCDLAGLEIPKAVTAKSFAPVLSGVRSTHHEAIFGYYTDTQRMIRTQDGWKLIDYPEANKIQLFDLNSDPHELNNLTGKDGYADRESSLQERLNAWRKEARDPYLSARNP